MITLEIHNVSKSFGGITAVNDWSATFQQGTVSALIGPNGAGKTTAFNLIGGFLKPDRGVITCHGQDITGKSPWLIAAAGVGRLFQDVRVFKRMTARENVLAAFTRQSGENVLLSIIARRKVLREQEELIIRANHLLESVGLGDKANELAETLSYGQQKLLALTRLLAADAKVLLLDEPTAGVNSAAAATLLLVIRKLSAEGRTIIIIEHNIQVVTEIADRAYFIDKGKITASGKLSEVLGDQAVKAAYIGIRV